MAPTIVFVPGFWEGAEPFAYITSLLQSRGFPCEIVELPSTGTVTPGNPGMHDDIAAIRSAITKLVENGETVVLVPHSAGGFWHRMRLRDWAFKLAERRALRVG